jgi:hypothetical protein
MAAEVEVIVATATLGEDDIATARAVITKDVAVLGPEIGQAP